MMAASVVAGIPGGMVADRLGPVRGIATGAWARVAITVAAAFLLTGPVGAIVIALAYSVVSQVFSAAELAFIRHLDAARPARGHAVLVVLQYAGQALGLLVLAPLLFWLGGTGLMIAGALVFTTATAGVAMPLLVAGRFSQHAGKHERMTVSLMPTLRFFGSEPLAGYAAGVLTFFELVMKAMVVALPVLAMRELRLGDASVILLAGGVVVGGAIGFLWAANMRPTRSESLMRPMMIGVSLVAFLLALSGNNMLNGTEEPVLTTGLLPLAVAVGLCLTLAPIAARAVLTDRAPIGHQARVFATQGFGTNVAVIVPLAIAGAGTELAGAAATFWLLAVLGAASVLAMELLPRATGNSQRAVELVLDGGRD